MSDDTDTDTGWRLLTKPSRSSAPRGTSGKSMNQRLNVDGSATLTPFVRLARTHALHAAGDAIVAIALAGSLFFSIDPSAARSRVLLYLVCTLAPFALVGPLIGPALDRMRGGRRLMIMLTLVLRAALMIVMIPNIDSLWLFPIAFAQLVLGKSYSVAKAATVPTTVASHEELVDKNARLAVLSALSGFVGAAPAVALQQLFGSSVTLGYAFVIYAIGVVAAYNLPRVTVDDPDVPDDELDIRSAGIRLAASAMSVLRGVVGFMFFMLAFAFRGGTDGLELDGIGSAAGAATKHALGFDLDGASSEPAWKLGLPLAFWGVGILVGNVVAPRLRQRFAEESMILGGLAAIFGAAVAATWAGGLNGAVLLALVIGGAPSVAKLAFDSVVQRDAPGANQGAAFGRFETRFQIAWVIGALVPVILQIPVRFGFVVVAAASLFAGLTYFAGSRAVRNGTLPAGPGEGGWFQFPGRNAGTADDGDEPLTGGGEEAVMSSAAPTVDPNATTKVAVVNTGIAPPAPPLEPDVGDMAAAEASVQGSSDPYADAFADVAIEPPHWVSAVPPGSRSDEDLWPPPWLAGHHDDRGATTASGTDDADPTPPKGNDY